MRFYTESHTHYCGIDLHARSMYVCILDREGEVLCHENLRSRPEPFLAAVAPYREGLVVAAECIFPWYWLADLCAREGIPFVLGHAPYMKAIHGGKARNDRIDAYKIAHLLRGGNLPMAYVYPPEMRATRDLLRRRLHLERRAKEHDRDAYHRLRSVPGIGKILALTILYEIHDVARFPRVQDFLSYARLVKCEHSSAGKRLGNGGAKVGNVHLKWAFSEAAVLFLRKNPKGQEHLRRLAGRHGKSKALSMLAAKLGRTVYHLLRRQRIFDPERFFAMS